MNAGTTWPNKLFRIKRDQRNYRGKHKHVLQVRKVIGIDQTRTSLDKFYEHRVGVTQTR